jgi:hypothetical protein
MAEIKISTSIFYFEVLHNNISNEIPLVQALLTNMGMLSLSDSVERESFIELIKELKDKINLIRDIVAGNKRGVRGTTAINNYISSIYNGAKRDSYIRTQIRKISDNIPKLKGLTTNVLNTVKELNNINIANITNLANLFVVNSETEKNNVDEIITKLRNLALAFDYGFSELKSILLNIGAVDTSCRSIIQFIERIEEQLENEEYGEISLTSINNEISMILNNLSLNNTVKFEGIAVNVSSDAKVIITELTSVFKGKVYDTTRTS